MSSFISFKQLIIVSYTTTVILSLSVIPSVIIGWIRFPKIGSTFIPFLLLITIAMINELTSFIVIRNHHSNAINTNIYSLLEGILIVWQFERWKLFKKCTLYILITLILTCWCIEIFLISNGNSFVSYFIIISSFIIITLSTNMINKLLLDQKPLLTNSLFLICICFIIAYTYNAIAEIFWMENFNLDPAFSRFVYRVFCVVNLLTNLTYVLAVLWIPRKRIFIVL
jgi:hypothetical protein